MLIRMIGRIEIEYRKKEVYKEYPDVIDELGFELEEMVRRNLINEYRKYVTDGIPGYVIFLKEKEWNVDEKSIPPREVAEFVNEKYDMVEEEVEEMIDEIIDRFGNDFYDYFDVYFYVDVDYKNVDYDYLHNELFPIFDEMDEEE